ncbi:histidine kinase [Tepiditoga spiralis]|uniref:Histidine kinase n=1 Tax=Tepiditoga spiralis TaxID=2108365 RepID=A0A7G1G8T8_9BACT|nr:DUF438 domain-containing protein [Tepiditoga spiralis]BBE31333.1 histidine kinase [Tepiditoga spiralis]
MSELFNNEEYLKNLIKRLGNEDNEELKKELKSTIKSLSPEVIAKVEQELIDKDGITVDEIQSVCDIHLDLFKDFTNVEKIEVEKDHPIFILMREHDYILKTVEKIREISKNVYKKNNIKEAFDDFMKLNKNIENIEAAEKYFLKEENVLFAYLEKHGIEQPPRVMWKEHNQIRNFRNKLLKLKDNRDFEDAKKSLYEISLNLNELFTHHVQKEHSVLFPTALNLINDEEWKEIRNQFDEIGYFCYFPKAIEKKDEKESGVLDDKIKLPSGEFTIEELINMFNTLPMDITFVDKNNRVKYFSETKDRIFVRSRAIIGRKVQNCHPANSVEIVNKIVNDFKTGKKDKADFWLRVGEKYVYLRYFAVRNKNNEYLGTVEVTQDIEPIQEIKGEKRIYDE